MMHIVLWKWNQANARSAYTAQHVEVMAAMLRRNLGVDHRIICVTDDPHGISSVETFPLWDDMNDLPNASGSYLPSCYRRLKLYDPKTQKALGIKTGDRIAGLDLDAVICGRLDELLLTEGRYIGWQMQGRYHRRVFNGSLQIFSAGDLQEIWSGFDPERSPTLALEAGYLGSDQAWLSLNLMDKAGSVGLDWPEVISYPLQAKIQGKHSGKTKIIFFHGTIKPWFPQALIDSPFIDRYWRL